MPGILKYLLLPLCLLISAAPCTASRVQPSDDFDELMDRAEILSDSCRYTEALRPALGALRVALEQNDKERRNEVYSCLSRVYFRIGVFDKAIVYATRCYEYDLGVGKPENISSSLHNLASIYLANSSFKPYYGLKFILEAVEIERGLDRRDVLAERLGLASELYCAMGDYANGEKSAREAISLVADNGPADVEAVCRRQLASCLACMGRDREAEAEALKALKVFERNGNDNSRSLACFLLGTLAQGSGEMYSARTYFTDVVEITGTTGNLALRLKALNSLAELMDRTNPVEACRWYREAASLRDSIRFERSLQQTMRYEVEADIREKEELIALQSQTVAFQKKELVFVIVILLFALCTIAGLAHFFVRLKRMNRKLENLNAVKDRFFSVISHDLRSPAIAQQTAAHMLMDNYGKLSLARRREICEGMVRLSDAHVDLLENLLKWAQLQVGVGYEVVRLRFNLSNAVREVMDTYVEVADRKEIRCRVVAPDGIFVETDRNFTLAIARNLLSNAVKFTPRGGEITVIVSEDDGSACLEVRDSGVGMSEETMSQLFIPGGVRSCPGTEKESGNGLGLVVAKEMADRCGSTLSVTSRLGEGTSFKLTIQKGNG